VSEILISLSNLSKSFVSRAGSVDVLKEVDLDIARGECVALVGQSGSGKSTLLSIIGLLDSATSGTYTLCGSAVSALSHYQLSILRNRNIGWIFQNFNLVSELSVLKNIELPMRYNSDIKKADYETIAMKQLTLVGLQDKAHSYPDQLSGGQQQRVAIARALVGEPDMLLCDEPTGNLDSKNSEQITDLLLELNKRGTTVLIVTHDNELAKKCERIIQISDGEINQ